MSKKARIKQLESDVSALVAELKRIAPPTGSVRQAINSMADAISVQCKDIADTRDKLTGRINVVGHQGRQIESYVSTLAAKQTNSDVATANTFTQLSTRVAVLERCVSDLQHSKVSARSELDDTIENDNK